MLINLYVKKWTSLSTMDTTLVPVRVKTSFSIEHILSKPDKSSASDYTNRCNKSSDEPNFGDSGASEQKRRSCEILTNTDQRSDLSNDGASIVRKQCATPDSSCIDACSDVASEESNCK